MEKVIVAAILLAGCTPHTQPSNVLWTFCFIMCEVVVEGGEGYASTSEALHREDARHE